MTTSRKALPFSQRPVLGWREWARLGALELPPIKIKIDTGARSSALHATELDVFDREGVPWVAFTVHPRQRHHEPSFRREAPVYEFRRVRSSSGHETERPVLQTPIAIGGTCWDIELTLSNRHAMGFRMLLGRHAMARRFRINPGASFVQGRPDGLEPHQHNPQ